MKLLFAHDHRFQRGAGNEIYTLGSFPVETWDRYLDHFDAVRVIARDGGPVSSESDLARSDRQSVSFELMPNMSSFRQLVFRSSALDRRMEQAVRDSDAVVARLPSEIGLLAIQYARRLGKPYAIEVVGCAWDGYFNNGSPAARLYAPVGFLRMRRAISSAPQALYVTSRWLQGRYPSHGFQAIASNVLLTRPDAAAVERREARLDELAKGRKPVLGTVGSLKTKAKGIQVAVAAIAELRKAGIDFDYRVLGPGDREPWQALARKFGVADLVRFDGVRPPGDAVFEWLDGIDIHLQPSFREGLPRATIEAMARGAACIGSTCGGIPELLPPDRLHSPGDVGGLANRIRSLATDPSAIALASRRDRDEVRQFDPEDLRSRRSAFYAELARRAKAQG